MRDCNQCGKCCIKYGDGGLWATGEEVEMWKIFQPHIFDHVRNDSIWHNPVTGERLTRCPFLEKLGSQGDSPQQEKYACSIYLDRPQDCRHYPTSIEEMVRDECEMIEVIDLEHPKRAQIKLDVLMCDSRPPRAQR